MAKLSHRITNNDDNQKSSNKNKLNLSLSTKINKNNDNKDNNEDKQKEKDTIKLEKLIEIPEKKQDFIKFLYEKIKFDNFGKIDKKFIEKLLPEQETPNNEQITKKIISQIITDDFINSVKNASEKINKKYTDIYDILKEEKEKIKKQEIQVKNLSSQIDDSEEQIFKIEKKYSNSISAIDLINENILNEISNEYTRDLSKMLLEAFKNNEKQGKEFVLKFLKGFIWIEDAILELDDSEKENMKKLHQAGKKLMQQISGTNCAERRPILDKIAYFCNSYLNDYDLVSAEQTLQIDPTIHNAEGLGGSIIKEGLSFAVVRRETRKAVYYAEIKTK